MPVERRSISLKYTENRLHCNLKIVYILLLMGTLATIKLNELQVFSTQFRKPVRSFSYSSQFCILNKSNLNWNI